LETEKGSPLLALTALFLFTTFFSWEVFLGLLSIILLLCCSALISGSEVAFFSLNHNDFEKLENENEPNSHRILALKEKPRMLLATILISNNFINIAIVILSDFVLNKIFPETVFLGWANSLHHAFPLLEAVSTAENLAGIISFLIIIVGVTFLLVLFGEVTPKFYATVNNLKLSRLMAGPLTVLMILFNPISRILVNWTTTIERRLAQRTKSSGLTSREDIDEAIELTAISDAEIEQEADILKSIVKFGEVSVTQIMRSRIDVTAVDFRITYQELLDVIKTSGYSRIPVYNEDFDNVTGILYVKDLLGHLQENASFEWQELIRTNVLFIPESKKIDDLLKEFQRERMHMAVVVDEYGGSSGIVTLEDILEEIIGEIKDEFDDDNELIYRKLDDYNYIFEGKTLLNDFCRILGLDTSYFDEIKGEADSIAGLILELYGELPAKDTEISHDTFCFKVTASNKRRIEQVLVTLQANTKVND
jgi:putative hemolysin